MNKILKKIIDTGININIDIKKNYKRLRKLNNIAKKRANNNNIFDYTINANNRDIPIRVFYPSGIPKQIIIYYHGGGWVLGNNQTSSELCTKIATSTNSIVFAIEYALAPEFKFPQGFNDCYAITDIIIKDSMTFKIPKRRVYLMGDSAGGNIAACISLKRRDQKKYMPKKQILIYPVTAAIRTKEIYSSVGEFEYSQTLSLKQLEDYIDLYLNNYDDKNNPYFSPLKATTLKKQPKTLLIVANKDILRDEGIEYARALADAKVKVQLVHIDEGHAYLTLFGESKGSKETIKIIKEFTKGR